MTCSANRRRRLPGQNRSRSCCIDSPASTSRAVRCAVRVGCRSRRSSCAWLHRRIPHDARLSSPSDGGTRRTRVRSAARCFAPAVVTIPTTGAGTTTGHSPTTGASVHTRRPSRSHASVKSHTAPRPSSLTIPIGLRHPSHAVSSNRVYPHGARAGVSVAHRGRADETLFVSRTSLILI